eukprot:m.151098 g.151098  ORF g.151098 m.151098 type:complete len:127 (-) comp14243_c0_seq7:1172-1552(-)
MHPPRVALVSPLQRERTTFTVRQLASANNGLKPYNKCVNTQRLELTWTVALCVECTNKQTNSKSKQRKAKRESDNLPACPLNEKVNQQQCGSTAGRTLRITLRGCIHVSQDGECKHAFGCCIYVWF